MQAGHALRDGKIWPNATPDPERYDLIIVGGGISGLSAAYFYRKIAGPRARILILENLDDFGGHAKRNEYHPPSGCLSVMAERSRLIRPIAGASTRGA